MERINVSILARETEKVKLWRTRIAVKLILSRLPLNYRMWAKLGLFRHGAMDDYLYAWEVLKSHASVLSNTDDWKGLELGPGDGLLSSFLAPALGSSGLTLVDARDFAHKDVSLYRQHIENFLASFPDLVLPDILYKSNIESMLLSVNGSYHSEGLLSLKGLKDSSYDLIYSQAVLEHVRRHEFEDTMKECYRLLSPNGVMSHWVDFKDHLGGGLNNMRFPSTLWELDWFASDSGFYTNRMRLSEMILFCEDIGFSVKVCNTRRWTSSPIKRTQLAREFYDLSDDDLLTSGAHLVMKPKY